MPQAKDSPILRLLLAEKLRTAIAVQPAIDGHRSLSVMRGGDCICMLKYDGAKLRCLLASGQSFDIGDTRPLDISDPAVELIAGLVR